jgi:hypothetical protein
VLRAADDQHPFAAGVEPVPAQVPGDGRPVVGAPAVRLVAQQRVEVPGGGEVATPGAADRPGRAPSGG